LAISAEQEMARVSEQSILLNEAQIPRLPSQVAAPAPTGHVHVPYWLMVAIVVSPWLLVAVLLATLLLAPTALGLHVEASKPSISITASPGAVLGNPGPWGQLEYRRIRIDLPDEFVFVPPPNQPPVHWVFSGSSKDQAIEFLKSSGITAPQLASIEKAKWTSEAKGAAVEPGDEFILSLAAGVRAKIYSRLIEFEENSRQIDPVWFETGHVDERVKDSGLSPASLELLNRLLYTQGPSLLLFADFDPALRRLPNDRERRLFMNAVSRKRTLLAGLCITPSSNVDAIVNYWGVGGRKKNIAPLVRALRHEGEAKINIICLLPEFPRDHIYMHSLCNNADAMGHKEDCFWSAMNFFNEPPDNRVNDMNYLGELIKNDYAAINQPSQLGDVIFLATQKGTAIHAAAYIADDIVFTKNGESNTQPWIFMRMDDMMDTYAVKYPNSGPLKALYYRKKSLF